MNMLASKGPRGSPSLRCQFELEKLALGGHTQKIDKVLLRDIQVVLGIKPVVSKSSVRNNLKVFTPRYIREQRGHIIPFKDQESANIVKTQLKDLSVKLQTIVQPVFTSRKIAQEFPTSEPKPQLIDQQCVVYNFKVTSVMPVISDTPVDICSYASMDIEARPRQCASTMIVDTQEGFTGRLSQLF